MNTKKNYRINTSTGIDEKIFVSINGQEQYVFIRGEDIKNPIILNLHGGPANPDSYLIYEFAGEISSDYTLVSWDQRGCGRTYYQNQKSDPQNQTASFEQAVKDVDALVDYLCKRFGKNKIIIMGHSYGSLLGVKYVHAHSEKVECYIGIGQTVSIMDTQTANYNQIMNQLNLENKKTDAFTAAYNTFKANPNIQNLTSFQRLSLRYFLKNLDIEQPNQLKLIFSSPDLSWKDVQWLLGMIRIKKHYARNKKLLDYTVSANIYNVGTNFNLPMFFISGEYDKSCNPALVKTYCEKIEAPTKKLVIMEKCGHSPQIDAPIRFANELRHLLKHKF